LAAADAEIAKSSPWAAEDIVAEAISGDERLWVNVLRTETSGVISRHRHACPVHGYVIDGRWHYLEHDWVAEPGGYVYEPAGDTHTLVIDDAARGHTLFWIAGAMITVDDEGHLLGYADVFTRIEEARRHFESVGLGADYVERLIR